jgi:hypothetical protein
MGKTMAKAILLWFGIGAILIAGTLMVTNREIDRRQAVDPLIFTDPTCLTACWNNITINQSTTDEVRSSLEELIPNLSIYQHPFRENNFTLSGTTENYLNVTATAWDGIVGLIELESEGFALRFQHVIDQIGHTDYVNVMYYAGKKPGGFLGPRQVWIAQAAFYYPRYGLVFYSSAEATEVDDHITACVQPDMIVNHISIAQTGSITTLLESLSNGRNLYKDVHYRNHLMEHLKPIQQFGCVDLVFPPETGLRSTSVSSW